MESTAILNIKEILMHIPMKKNNTTNTKELCMCVLKSKCNILHLQYDANTIVKPRLSSIYSILYTPYLSFEEQ